MAWITHLVAVLKDQDDCLEQACLGVESESKLAVRPVFVIERLNPERPVDCLDSIFG